MHVLKTKKFAVFCQDHGIADGKLVQAIKEVEEGLIDAELGAGMVKKRLAREGEGKSGGFRTIIVYKRGRRAIFLHAFPKNVADNIDKRTLDNLKLLAKAFNSLNDAEISIAIAAGKLLEMPYEDN
jgi:hypothetical protein